MQNLALLLLVRGAVALILPDLVSGKSMLAAPGRVSSGTWSTRAAGNARPMVLT